jgi:hypothetical protein
VSVSNVINGKVPDTGLLKGSVHAIIGRDGYSAYQLAQKHGFVGTEEEWLLSLNGVDGTVEFDKLTAAQKESLRGERGVPGVYIGSGNMPAGYNVQIDPNGDSFSADELARISNPNLLDNWYFADPVNQRGQTEYTGTGYTIDRWKHDGTLAINDGYVTHTPNEWWNALYQPIDAKIANALIGRKVTLSVLARSAVSGNQMRIALYDITANNMEETVAYINTYGDLEVLAATFTVPESFAGHLVSAHFSVSTNFAGQGGSADLVAVKLETGDKQTLAHKDANGKWVLNDIPDYGDMLLKCQQYMIPFGAWRRVRAARVESDAIHFEIPVTRQMRIKPTLVNNSGIGFVVYAQDGSATFTVDGVSVEDAGAGYIRLVVGKAAHGFTDAHLANNHSDPASVYFDAEL